PRNPRERWPAHTFLALQRADVSQHRSAKPSATTRIGTLVVAFFLFFIFFFRPPLKGEGWVGMCGFGVCFFSSSRRRPGSSSCFLSFRAHAKTDSRPCELRPPSWRTSYFSLLAQREVTKRKAPSRP